MNPFSALEAARWRQLARRWERAHRETNPWNGESFGYRDQRVYGNMPVEGLCEGLAAWPRDDEVRYEMEGRLKQFKPENALAHAYWWPLTAEGAGCRVLAAGLLAAMAEAREPV